MADGSGAEPSARAARRSAPQGHWCHQPQALSAGWPGRHQRGQVPSGGRSRSSLQTSHVADGGPEAARGGRSRRSIPRARSPMQAPGAGVRARSPSRLVVGTAQLFPDEAAGGAPGPWARRGTRWAAAGVPQPDPAGPRRAGPGRTLSSAAALAGADTGRSVQPRIDAGRLARHRPYGWTPRRRGPTADMRPAVAGRGRCQEGSVQPDTSDPRRAASGSAAPASSAWSEKGTPRPVRSAGRSVQRRGAARSRPPRCLD